jgi:hypothetical protein
MTAITDDYMNQMLATVKPYTVMILQKTAVFNREKHLPVIREHGRRNFELRAAGKLSIVCPVRDETDVAGVGIFNLSPDETKLVMEDDPGVKAGIFSYEVHPSMSFPGDSLPG